MRAATATCFEIAIALGGHGDVAVREAVGQGDVVGHGVELLGGVVVDRGRDDAPALANCGWTVRG